VCVTRIRIRILESGSIKCTLKHKTQKDSGSGLSPDPRILPKLKANASGSGFLNPDSGIFYADPRSASDPYSFSTDPLLLVPIGPFSCFVGVPGI